MAKQETLTLFPETETVTRKLSDEQFGKLIRAVFAYRFRGESYDGDDIGVDVAFQFLANQVDRGETAKALKANAAKSRWEQGRSEVCKPMQMDAGECKPMQKDAEGCKSVQRDAPILSCPVQSYPVQSSNNGSKADKPPAPAKAARKSYGEFGWVKLTDDEYHRLLNDLGEAEVKRCIAYVDESAQTTGNKNKWRDWNLVLRKCHKQGWGLLDAYGQRQARDTGKKNPFLEMLEEGGYE